MSKKWEKFMTEFEETGIIRVSQDDYDELVARLNEPPKPNERLKKLMATPAPWEVGK